MTLKEAIKHCEDVADYDCFTDDQRKCSEEHRQLADWLRELKERREKDMTGDLISRQTALSTIEANQGTLNKRKVMKILEGLPSAESEHLVKESGDLVKGLVNDCINRQDAIDAINAYLGLSAVSRTIQNMTSIQEILENLPSASIDLSTFSDKLWKIAYERGKTEGRKKRKWKGKEKYMNSPEYFSWQCSVCGCVLEDSTLDKPYPFCPNCGSYNGGEEE